MTQIRSWALRTLTFPAVVLVGIANLGCPGNTSSTGDSSGGGGSGANGGHGGHGGSGANGGHGGSGANGGHGGSGANGGSTANGGHGGSAAGGHGGNGGSGGTTCVPEEEICDGQDNDCDGDVDDVLSLPDGCMCSIGDMEECYEGPEGTLGIGQCVAGARFCADGVWSDCDGQVLPQDEQCNFLDDDCDGADDDMGTAACGVGACAAIVDVCVNGQPQSCVPGQPSFEVCDGVDNNCNQLVDESDPLMGAACATGDPGVCASGTFQCVGQMLACVPSVMPGAEICDGLDNDCDGLTDDAIPGTGGVCNTGLLGVCSTGTISCQLQIVYQIDCYSNVPASSEICDGLDNDCDGTVDEPNPNPCN